VNQFFQVAFGDHAGQELEGSQPNGFVLVGQALQHQVPVLHHRFGVRPHQLHEAHQAQVPVCMGLVWVDGQRAQRHKHSARATGGGR